MQSMREQREIRAAFSQMDAAARRMAGIVRAQKKSAANFSQLSAAARRVAAMWKGFYAAIPSNIKRDFISEQECKALDRCLGRSCITCADFGSTCYHMRRSKGDAR